MTISFDAIRKGAQWVCDHADHIRIHDDTVPAFVNELSGVSQDAWFESMPIKLEKQSFEDQLRFALMFNCTSFCYWQKPKWRVVYNGEELGGSFSLSSCYVRAINDNPELLNPEQWVSLQRDDYLEITRVASGRLIPLAEERVKALQSMGQFLSDRYDGSVEAFVTDHNFDAEQIVKTLAGTIYGFDDVSRYKDHTIALLKRAQLTVADIAKLYQKHRSRSLHGADGMTACADYKLPQIMRHFGLISYNDELSRMIDQEIQLPSGSDPEIELRAACIHVVELIRAHLKNSLTSNQISDQIWLLSQRSLHNIKPHHQTVSIHY